MPVEIPKDKWPGSVKPSLWAALLPMAARAPTRSPSAARRPCPSCTSKVPRPTARSWRWRLRTAARTTGRRCCSRPGASAVDDPAAWAKAAEDAGADVIELLFSLTDADGNPTTPDVAVERSRRCWGDRPAAAGVWTRPGGCGQRLLVAVAEATKGERLVLGICEDKNYRTIVATAMANGHLVSARTPMDVNLAKQLNILISDMGLPADRILMDPTTGALGYGIEYGYSVMERLRLAALQGDVNDPVAHARHPRLRSLEDQRSEGRRGRPRSLGRLARTRDQLGNAHRHGAARIRRGHHRPAPS